MQKEYFFKTDQLVIWRPKGVLDTDKIIKFISFLDESSQKKDPHFNRFVDLTKTSGISVNYDSLYPIARQRKEYFRINIKRKFKMAFLTDNPLTFGMARMYQMISEHPFLEVGIFETLEQAAVFLEVDIAIITV